MNEIPCENDFRNINEENLCAIPTYVYVTKRQGGVNQYACSKEILAFKGGLFLSMF